MDDDENLDDRGALIVGPEMPRRGPVVAPYPR